MAIWNRNKVPPANLNAGQQYTAEDWTSEQTFNAANNNAFYAVDYAEALGDTPDTSQVGNIGTPTVTLIDNVKTIDGVEKTFKKFKFANLKGEKGDDGNDANVVQEFGTSTVDAISQKVITDKFDEREIILNAHIASPLPHKMLVDGVAYNYGLSQADGFVKFIYEEEEE